MVLHPMDGVLQCKESRIGEGGQCVQVASVRLSCHGKKVLWSGVQAGLLLLGTCRQQTLVRSQTPVRSHGVWDLEENPSARTKLSHQVQVNSKGVLLQSQAESLSCLRLALGQNVGGAGGGVVGSGATLEASWDSNQVWHLFCFRSAISAMTLLY